MVPTNMETETLTGFVNEACDQVSVRGAGYTRLTEMYTDTSVITDVKDYFSRPKLINTIAYGTSTTPLLTLSVTNTYLQSTLYNFSRVLGAFGYRATVCFRLQAVSNPFQAGILRMAFSPFQVPNTAAYYDRTVGLTSVSQLPGVELDLAESTSCVLKIPFIHPYNYFYVATPETAHYEKLGDLVVFPYTPVVLGAGATQPSLALWLWLEDFELVSATCATYTSQSGIPTRNKAASSKEADKIPGNLSNVLAAGSHLATWLGTKIPLISSYAGPTSWFMRQASHIAASYGWARPIAVTVPNKIIQTDNVYQNNSDGPDPSFALGLFSDNAVAPLPGFAGASVDEMSFDYIKSVYACVSSFDLSTSQVSGSYARAVQLSPSAMFYQTGTLYPAPVNFFPNGFSGLSIWPSPVFALANVFGKWRGGFKFRVKIAKTKFHTGRLILGFTPAQSSVSVGAACPSDPTNMQFKSAIWDLRESNMFEFECPFTSPYSYLDFQANYGSFFVAILEPLAGPSTVAQTVPCRIEVAGMDDFEVSCPQPPSLPLAPQSTNFVAQSGLSSVLHDSASEHPSLHCIGEKVNSVKQMITRAGVVAFSAASGYFTYTPNTDLPTWDSVITPTTLNGVNKTYFNYFSAFFMMSRGGYHLHAVPVGKDVTLCGTNYDIFRLTGASFVSESATALHVKVPYYNSRSRDIVPETTAEYGNLSRAQISYSMPGSGTQSVIISARAADDFQYGYFVGAPPLAVPFDDLSSLDSSVRSALIGTH